MQTSEVASSKKKDKTTSEKTGGVIKAVEALSEQVFSGGFNFDRDLDGFTTGGEVTKKDLVEIFKGLATLQEAADVYIIQACELYAMATGKNYSELQERLADSDSRSNEALDVVAEIEEMDWERKVSVSTNKLTHVELMEKLEKGAQAKRGLSAEEFLDQYRKGTLENPGDHTDLLGLTYLIDNFFN